MATVFREEVEKTPVEPEKPVEAQPSTGVSEVEPPFTDYEQAHGQPFIVDHYELGDSWKEKMGGFTPEVQEITTYLMRKIGTKEIDNSLDAVKEEIKGIPK